MYSKKFKCISHLFYDTYFYKYIAVFYLGYNKDSNNQWYNDMQHWKVYDILIKIKNQETNIKNLIWFREISISTYNYNLFLRFVWIWSIIRYIIRWYYWILKIWKKRNSFQELVSIRLIIAYRIKKEKNRNS